MKRFIRPIRNHNPSLVALDFLQSSDSGLTIDEASFIEVSKTAKLWKLGDTSYMWHPRTDVYEVLKILAAAGDFVIEFGERVTALTVQQWQAKYPILPA